MFRVSFAEVADRIRRNDLRLAGAAVITEELAICSAAIDDVGIGGIGRDIAALASSGGVPVAEGDCAVIAAAKNKDAAAILLRAVNVVREIIVNRYVIELRRGLVIPTAPGVAGVHANARALITAKNHPLRMAGINPEGMIIIAAGSAFDGDESFPCVRGAIDGDIRQIDGIWIFRINIDFAEIPESPANTRISSGACPGLPAVV